MVTETMMLEAPVRTEPATRTRARVLRFLPARGGLRGATGRNDDNTMMTEPPDMEECNPPASTLRLVVVDGTTMFRELLKESLTRWFRPASLRDFNHGADALASCAAEPPDLIIVDLYLRDYDGREFVRDLRRRGVNTRVIMLTAYSEARLPSELVALGVAGFIDKKSPLGQIQLAVRHVLEGGMFFMTSVPPPVPQTDEPELPKVGAEVLTRREKEIVQLVARGMLSKEIAHQLGLSARTVEKHRAHIIAKVQLRDLPTLVRWCMRQGLG